MMLRKKGIAILLAIMMMLSFMLTACGQDVPASPEGQSPAAPNNTGGGETTVLQYYHWTSEQQPLYDELIPLFEKKNPDVKIETTVVPYNEYWTLLQTSIPAGNGPDVFLMSNSRYDRFRDADMLENLSPYMENSNLKLDDLSKSVLEMFNGDGNLYGVPKDCDSLALFYNKKLFDELGEPYPTDDWTWDDCFEFSKRVSKPAENFYGFLITTSDDTGYVPYLRSHGGYFVNEDRVTPEATKPVIAERLEIWRAAVQGGYHPSVALMDEMGNDQLFMNGQVAMMVDGVWMLAPYMEAFEEGTLDMVQVPLGSDHRDITSGSTCISIAPNSEKKEQAWKFTSFFVEEEALEIIAKYNLTPYQSHAEDWTGNFPGVNAAAFTQGLGSARDSVEANDRSLPDPFAEAVSRALTTDEPIADILNDIQGQMEAIAAREN